MADPQSAIGRLRSILGSFLFSGDQVDKRVAVLSGGEKARVALAKMLVRPAALLCMDEPTNHLDLASKEVLEEALATFNGTIVFISHDRYFINRIATHVVEVGRGRLTTHLGNYDEYLERKAGVEAAPAPPNPREHSAGSKPSPPRSAPRPSRKGLEREIKAIKERLQGIETQISAMERRLEEIGLALADPDLYRDGERVREIAQARKVAEQKVVPDAKRRSRASYARPDGGSDASRMVTVTTAAAKWARAISPSITWCRSSGEAGRCGATSCPPARIATRQRSHCCRGSGTRIFFVSASLTPSRYPSAVLNCGHCPPTPPGVESTPSNTHTSRRRSV